MKIAVASDHAGFVLKSFLAAQLRSAGHEIVDLGTWNEESVDYPDFGAAAGRCVAGGQAELGVCCCGTGIGISIAANKIPGVRAAIVHDVTTARLAREHNNANIVCMGGRIVGTEVAKDALFAFLGSSFQGGRHSRRVEKLSSLDSERGRALDGSNGER